jgi:hypothetical protein
LFLGVLTYLIFNHDGMAERTGKAAATSQAQLDNYVRETAGAGGPASEIEEATDLLASDAITKPSSTRSRQERLDRRRRQRKRPSTGDAPWSLDRVS